MAKAWLRRLLNNTYYEHILPPVADKADKETSILPSFVMGQWENLKGLWHKEANKEDSHLEKK